MSDIKFDMEELTRQLKKVAIRCEELSKQYATLEIEDYEIPDFFFGEILIGDKKRLKHGILQAKPKRDIEELGLNAFYFGSAILHKLQTPKEIEKEIEKKKILIRNALKK